MAREEISTSVAEQDPQRVHLQRVAVARELQPRSEAGVGTDAALDLLDRPTCPIGLRSREQCPVPLFEIAWDLEAFVPRLLLLWGIG